MKLNIRLTIILVSIFSFSLVEANEIDNLKTDNDIENFIRTKFGREYKLFNLLEVGNIPETKYYKHFFDSLKLNPWEITDFNGDSESDLFVYGNYVSNKVPTLAVLVIIYKSDDHYRHYNLLARAHWDHSFVFQLSNNSDLGSIILQYKYDPKKINHINNSSSKFSYSPSYTLQDTLLFKFENFIEFNSNPSNKEISKIQIKNYSGQVAVFEMDIIIDCDGNAVMIAGGHYDEKIEYRTEIQSEILKNIFEMINYIDPIRLQDDYLDTWHGSHHGGFVETIFSYSDGTHKRIFIQGINGTIGITALNNFLFSLKDSQSWQIIK